jgi:hypothetical protein
MVHKRIVLRHLAFTGSRIDDVKLTFSRGLNIIYGASNTGKSFVAKALQFMLAATTKLPRPNELEPYTGVWLGLTMPDGKDVTLYRPVKGGAFRLYDGLVSRNNGSSVVLRGLADAQRSDTTSNFILDSIGLSGKVVAKNASGEKEDLAIRHVLPYAIVSEGDIMAETSPIYHSKQFASRTFEKNLLRLMLSGSDDRDVVTTVRKETYEVATAAKIELVDELILQIDREVGEDPRVRDDLEAQLKVTTDSMERLQDELRVAQEHLDDLMLQRRSLTDERRQAATKAAELGITMQRFFQLNETYTSDLRRLEALEEGGLALIAMTGRECPVCGASTAEQRHHHADDEIALVRRSAKAELSKIMIEQADLKRTMTSLAQDESDLQSKLSEMDLLIENLELEIRDARPIEGTSRSKYLELIEQHSYLRRFVELSDRRAALSGRRSELSSERPAIGEQLSSGIDDTMAFELGKAVASVLERWGFPDFDKVQYDLKTNDVSIGGKRRDDNGKGVRAILHAAFNVALLLYCQENTLPHPGFLVLDTPLLTYREPLTSKHGELADDEARLKRSPLALKFYSHLAELEGSAQFIVLENADPPAEALKLAKVQVFTGRRDEGRYGLFPV